MRFTAGSVAHFACFRSGEEFALDVPRERAPLSMGDEVSRLAGFAQGGIADRGSGDHPAIDIRDGKNPGQSREPGNVRIFPDGRVDGREETGEPRGAETLERQFECARMAEFPSGGGRRTFRANGQKKLRHGLELVNAAAQQSAASFEKNETAALHDGADEVRDSGMLQRLASADPENGCGTEEQAANSFVRNGMCRTGMQDFCGVDEINEVCRAGSPEESGDTSFCEFSREQRGEAHAGQNPLRSRNSLGWNLRA